MRVPAVALAVAFAGGILLGRQTPLAPAGSLNTRWIFSSQSQLFLCFSLSFSRCAATCGRPLPPEHVLSRIAAGQLDLKTPLRWYGRLREEPTRLPWGYGIELDLSRVETAQGMIPVAGGMRLGFTPKGGDPSLPELHASDEVSLFSQARSNVHPPDHQ